MRTHLRFDHHQRPTQKQKRAQKLKFKWFYKKKTKFHKRGRIAKIEIFLYEEDNEIRNVLFVSNKTNRIKQET